MNAYSATAQLLGRALADMGEIPGIAASTRSSPALDRAELYMATAYALKLRQRRWQHVKLGAETILNDLQAGNSCTFERALKATRWSDARRQAALALRWRAIRGTKAVPPTWRGVAARKVWERMGVSL